MRATLSMAQIELAKIIGIRTNAESRVIDGVAATQVIVWDEKTFTRWPVFIQILNLHATEKLYLSEDLRDANGNPICSAKQFTEILPPSTGNATDDGTGGRSVWNMQRPSCVSIFGTNAWRAVVIIRYVDQN